VVAFRPEREKTHGGGGGPMKDGFVIQREKMDVCGGGDGVGSV